MIELLRQPESFLGLLLVFHLFNFFFGKSFSFVAASLFAFLWMAWMPEGPLHSSIPLLDLELTSYRRFFGFIISGLGAVIGIYAHIYMRKYTTKQRFFGLLGLFQWSCLLLILSNHALMFAIAWELTSITSFLLIGFNLKSKEAQRGAFQALLVTGFGGLALLGGVILMGFQAESFLLSDWSSKSFSNLSVALVMLGIFTKSAQFPFHFWLPGAMSAPTPVSAYLHSATLVKLGVFAAGLLDPFLNDVVLWHVGLSGVGLFSFAFGAVFSLFQRDLKAGLAYTTFSQLGLILMLFGQRSELAYTAALLVTFGHALYKSCLFLIVGIIADGTGTQDIRRMSGFRKLSPALWIICLLAAISMAGIPPSLGFLGKEFALAPLFGRFATPFAFYFSWVCFGLGAIGSIIYASMISVRPFIGELGVKYEKIRFQPLMIASIAPLALFGAIAGLFHQSLEAFLRRPSSDLSAYPHLLTASLSLLSTGLVLSFLLHRSASFWSKDWPTKLAPLGLTKLFQSVFLKKLPAFADRCISVFETQFKRNNQSILFLSLFMALAGFLNFSWWPKVEFFSASHSFFGLLLFFCGVLAVTCIVVAHPVVQIFVLGTIGIFVSLLFAVFGAPDLVLTQLLVETGTLILLILAWMVSRAKSLKTKEKRPWRAWLFSAMGGFIAVYAFFQSFAFEFQKLSSLYFFENSKLLGGGNNIVNVILVDFRGIDTLGEITVLAIALLGVRALSSRQSKLSKKIVPHPFVTDWSIRLGQVMFWMVGAFGIYFLLRGHNAPGGGFIGGLLLALAIFIRMMMLGKPAHALKQVALGLFIAYFSALLPHFMGLEVFQSFPSVFGPSSLLFDVGVFFTVSGSIAGIIEVLLRMKARSWAQMRSKRLA